MTRLTIVSSDSHAGIPKELTGAGPDVTPDLIEHFEVRGGYLKPAEGAAKLALLDQMLSEDYAAPGVEVGAVATG